METDGVELRYDWQSACDESRPGYTQGAMRQIYDWSIKRW
jgi:hypothetical protein